MRKKNIIVTAAHLAFILILLSLLFAYEKTGRKLFSFLTPMSLKPYACEDTVNVTPEYISNDLILVNRDHPIPSDFTPDPVFYRDTDVLMGSEIIESYGEMSDHIRETFGDRIYVSSTYRTTEDQTRIYEEEGPEIAAAPGTSEHQTGLAVDLYTMYHAGMAFLDSPVGRYVNEHCSDFGFIIRYPDGKEDVTGFSFEPWHIRYVGQPHARIISENDLTLEEYLDMLEPGSWYSYNEYVLGRVPEDNIVVPSSLAGCNMSFSRDLCGYVIVTIVT